MNWTNLKRVLTGKPRSASDFITLWALMMFVVVAIQAVYATLSPNPVQYILDWAPLTAAIAIVLGIGSWVSHRRRSRDQAD